MKITRLIALALAGVAIILSATYGAAVLLERRASATEQLRLQAQLTAAQAEVERTRASELKLRVSLLSADGSAVAYIADALQAGGTVDAASISDLLVDRREQLGLDTIGVIGVDGRWVAGTRPWTDGGASPARHPIYTQSRDSQSTVLGIVRDEQRLLLAAVTPMLRAGTVDAYWYAAIALDADFLRTLAALAPFDFALIARQPSAALAAQSADLPEADWLRMAEIVGPGTSDKVTNHAQGAARPAFGSAEQALLLAKPVSVSAAQNMLTPLLYLAALWSVLWLLGLLLIWRSVWQPLDTACGLLERAALGDFHLRAPAWNGGVRGRFAVAFDSLMLRLGAQR